jgi:chromate reductase, NAD(P)H dehydrogenase (quinone)
MSLPKILVFAGSIRSGSFNARLAALAVKELTVSDIEVTRVSLADFPMPIYDGDLEAQSGPPDNAVKLKRLMMTHRGIFIVSPEYNASVTPLMKNTLDWISRVREANETPLAAYRGRIFALGAASNGSLGGYRSLMALRQILELGCGATVIPEMISVREAASAFDDHDQLREERSAKQLRTVLSRLIEAARNISVK